MKTLPKIIYIETRYVCDVVLKRIYQFPKVIQVNTFLFANHKCKYKKKSYISQYTVKCNTSEMCQ